jgi:hypothetical protein
MELMTRLERYEYASIQHNAIALMWHMMMRVVGVQAIDVDDYDSKAQCIKIRNRSNTGTVMKNQDGAERIVAHLDYVCDFLKNWLVLIMWNRPDTIRGFRVLSRMQQRLVVRQFSSQS